MSDSKPFFWYPQGLSGKVRKQGLTPAESALLMEMLTWWDPELGGENGRIAVTLGELAESFGCDHRKVRMLVRNLERSNLLVRVVTGRGRGRPNIWTLSTQLRGWLR